jgi:hypothetical protein
MVNVVCDNEDRGVTPLFDELQSGACQTGGYTSFYIHVK